MTHLPHRLHMNFNAMNVSSFLVIEISEIENFLSDFVFSDKSSYNSLALYRQSPCKVVPCENNVYAIFKAQQKLSCR